MSKSDAADHVKRCKDCIKARGMVQRVFLDVRSKVQREPDRELQPYIEKLVAHYDKGAKEHEQPLKDAKAALENCQWVSAIRY